MATVLGVCVFATAGTRAAPPDSQPADHSQISDAMLVALVRQLDDRSYRVRQEATRQLAAMPFDAIDRLIPLYKSASGAEQKGRIKQAVQEAYFAAQRAGQVPEGFLGVQHVQLPAGQVDPNLPAVLVSGVIPDSPADKAGLRVGDAIVRLNGDALDIRPGQQFADRVRQMPPGARIKLGVRRDGQKLDLEVTLGSRANFAIADNEYELLARFSVYWHDRFDPKDPVMPAAGQVLLQEDAVFEP